MTDNWDWYVGDPCYVIEQARWSEFCDLFFAEEKRIRDRIREGDPERWEYVDENGDLKQRYIPINHEVIIDWPILDDDGEELWTVEIEVWSSPYGDGVWQFKDSNLSTWKCTHVTGNEIGVDAGIIAIVPSEACAEDIQMGLYFASARPTLETYEGDFEVKVNDVTHDGIFSCVNCGHEGSVDSFYDCGHCYGCGPEEEEEWW